MMQGYRISLQVSIWSSHISTHIWIEINSMLLLLYSLLVHIDQASFDRLYPNLSLVSKFACSEHSHSQREQSPYKLCGWFWTTCADSDYLGVP